MTPDIYPGAQTPPAAPRDTSQPSMQPISESRRRKDDTGNLLLNQVMRLIRVGRPYLDRDKPFYVRMDRACGGDFAQVWFLTRGCTWDRGGACTMCNYGHAHPVPEDSMVESVREGLGRVPRGADELYVSPSGSLLDPLEVPPRARRLIYELVASFPCSKFSLETRAETVTPEAVDELVAAMGDRTVAVGMGLESSSPWILKFCINKKGHPTEFEAASQLLRERGVGIYANVSLGAAFLTTSEAIEDAAKTVQWALTHGADMALVFPMHIKAHTLLAWLHQQGLYQPPSLWSLVEVLARIEPEFLPRVTISWYRNDYGDGPEVIVSPSTCPRCRSRVLESLDRFRYNPTSAAVAHLVAQECECKDVWRRELEEAPERALPERVLDQYEHLARTFNLTDWWSTRQQEISAEVLGSDAPHVEMPVQMRS